MAKVENKDVSSPENPDIENSFITRKPEVFQTKEE